MSLADNFLDTFLIAVAFVISYIVGDFIIKPIAGDWCVPLGFILLFLLLWKIAEWREWSYKSVDSYKPEPISKWILDLALIAIALTITGFLATLINDIFGVVWAVVSFIIIICLLMYFIAKTR
jgi:ABC-type xylose transport system permease subunit